MVVNKGGEMWLTLCVRTLGFIGGCVCGVRGDDREDEEGDDEWW